MQVDGPQQRLAGQLAGGQFHDGKARKVITRLAGRVRRRRAGRDRAPWPRVGLRARRDVLIQLGMQDRDVGLIPGPQPDLASA
jgi:hypothetical protein